MTVIPPNGNSGIVPPWLSRPIVILPIPTPTNGGSMVAKQQVLGWTPLDAVTNGNRVRFRETRGNDGYHIPDSEESLAEARRVIDRDLYLADLRKQLA